MDQHDRERAIFGHHIPQQPAHFRAVLDGQPGPAQVLVTRNNGNPVSLREGANGLLLAGNRKILEV
jgi:hypothetical protein